MIEIEAGYEAGTIPRRGPKGPGFFCPIKSLSNRMNQAN